MFQAVEDPVQESISGILMETPTRPVDKVFLLAVQKEVCLNFPLPAVHEDPGGDIRGEEGLDLANVVPGQGGRHSDEAGPGRDPPHEPGQEGADLDTPGRAQKAMDLIHQDPLQAEEKPVGPLGVEVQHGLQGFGGHDDDPGRLFHDLLLFGR